MKASLSKPTATGFSPTPRKPPTSMIYGVDLAVLVKHDVADLADILVIGAVDRGADQLLGRHQLARTASRSASTCRSPRSWSYRSPRRPERLVSAACCSVGGRRGRLGRCRRRRRSAVVVRRRRVVRAVDTAPAHRACGRTPAAPRAAPWSMGRPASGRHSSRPSSACPYRPRRSSRRCRGSRRRRPHTGSILPSLSMTMSFTSPMFSASSPVPL